PGLGGPAAAVRPLSAAGRPPGLQERGRHRDRPGTRRVLVGGDAGGLDDQTSGHLARCQGDWQLHDAPRRRRCRTDPREGASAPIAARWFTWMPWSSTGTGTGSRPEVVTMARWPGWEGSSMATRRAPRRPRARQTRAVPWAKPEQTRIWSGLAATPRTRPREVASACRRAGCPRGSP